MSALSGAGKSTIAKCIRDSIRDKNPNMKFKMLLFNFEMLAFQQISRTVVSNARIKLRNLYSVDSPLVDEEFARLQKYYDVLAKSEIYFVEKAGTWKQICQTILEFYEDECHADGYTLIYEIDHALLTKGSEGSTEKSKIDDLMVGLVDVKKTIASNNGSSIGIVLSQMNREIKSVERRMNAEMNKPDTGCLFGALTC